MIFDKEFLADMGGKTVYDKLVGHTRWAVAHERVFAHEGKFYLTCYSVAATEMQDQQPYCWDDEQIECPEVMPVERTHIQYIKVTP